MIKNIYLKLNSYIIFGLCYLIKFYRVCISFLLPTGRCIFEPSCSVYFEGCVKKHGLLKGSKLGFFRIMRCHPYSQGGNDPVPD